MTCSLNIKAPNGRNSILFEDLVAVTPTLKEAVDAYYWTQSDEFKDAYKGKTDINGEPVLTEITGGDENYNFMKEYNKVELDNAADVYKSLIDAIPRMIDTIDERIEYAKRTKTTGKNIAELVELRKFLEEEPINTSLPKFIQMAKRHTQGLNRRAKKFFSEANDKPIQEVLKSMDTYYKVATSYNILIDVANEFKSNPELAESLDAELDAIDETANAIRSVENLYLAKAREFLADEFNKRNPSWSKAEIMRELKEAPRDANMMQQLLEYMGDSHDAVLSMVGRIMMEAEHTKRRESLEFSKELQVKLENLEKASPLKGEAIFKDALIESPTGEIHVVDLDARNTMGQNAWVDKHYQQAQIVKANKPLYEFVKFYNDTMKKLHASLPGSEGIGTRIPTVLRSEWELIQGKSPKEQYELVADKVKKHFLKSNLDMERGMLVDAHGKPVRRIPIFYNRRYDSIDKANFKKDLVKQYIAEGMQKDKAEEKADPIAEQMAVEKMSSLVSRDLANSLQSFHTMAINYAAKNELLYIFDAAENVVGSDTRRYVKKDSSGTTVLDQNGKPRYVFGKDSKAFKQLTKFLDMHLYGQKEADLGFVNIGGIKYDTNSLLRALNTSTGYVMQAANVLAGLGNYFNGEFNNLMEGAGGEFYTIEDYRRASALYKDNLFGIMKDIGARTPNNLINLLDEHYNLLQSFGGDKLSTTERTKARRLMKLNSMYFIQASGEHFMQTRAGLAVMNKLRVYDKDGNDVGNLLDQHSVKDGKLIIKEGLYVKERDGSLVKYDTIQQNRVGDRIGAMLRKSHGNYSQQTANAAQQDARLALILKFRGWMYEGIMKRWGKSREFHLLEGEREGFYRTGWEALGVLMKDMRRLQFDLSREHWASLTDHEKANIRRAVVEASAITATFVAGALLGKAGKLMDDEFSGDTYTDRLALGSYQMMLYQTNRLYTEIFAYLNPIEAVRLTRSPMAATNLLENAIGILGDVASIPIQGLEQYEQGWREGQYKLGVKLEKLIPVYKQIATLNADGIKDRGAWLPK